MMTPTRRAQSILGAAAICALTATAANADALATPSMAGPLAANPNPYSVDLPDWFGDAGGKIYVSGAATGLFLAQTDAVSGDQSTRFDMSNAQVMVQKTDGWLQFFVEAGLYSFPTLGVPYTLSTDNTTNTFGYAPVAYLKLQGQGALSSFSLEGGKLPTLIGDEYGFTFQNMNIERGLLWNIEPIVSRGVQLNYTMGALTVSLALDDGFYTNTLNDISGLVSYGFNGGADTVAFTAEGNLASNFHYYANDGLVGSLLNAGSVYDLIYTHTSGPWTISPYFQYISVPKLIAPKGAEVLGGAVLVSYSFNDNWKIAARGEYESSTGTTATTWNVLGYGAGSDAWSITVTPSYQYKIFFARVDASYTGIGSIHPGYGFGGSGNSTSQIRGLIEAGVLF